MKASTTNPKHSWRRFAVFVGVITLILASISFFHETDRQRLTKAANRGYEIIEPSSEYLESQASLLEINEWAEKGKPAAQLELSKIYWKGGRGLHINLDKAVDLAKKAAEKNEDEYKIKAAWLLYSIYTFDYPNEKKDKAEGEKWLKVAADLGSISANSLLGAHMLGIYGDPARPDKAVFYLDRAAKMGDGDAIYWLGECYANGWGVQSSAQKAIDHLSIAANMEESFTYKPVAQRKLAEAFQYGYGVRKNQQTAFEYLLKASHGGDLAAMIGVADSYLKGKGVVPSNATALMWVYANRALGGILSEKLVNEMERWFSNQELVVIRNNARDLVAKIKAFEKTSSSSTPPTPKQSGVSSGTGVIISSEGLVVTAAHVVEGSRNIEVCVQGGKRTAMLVEIDPKNDLAILRIGGSGYYASSLAPSRDIKLGQSVFTIGYPNTEIQGASPKFTKGEISSVSGIRDEPTQWQISVPVQSGNSGSPLFDESGNVVGIVVSKLNALETAKTTGDLVQNVNYAVKNAYLIPMLEKFNDKLPTPRKRGFFQKFESVVEDSKKSVVLILAY